MRNFLLLCALGLLLAGCGSKPSAAPTATAPAVVALKSFTDPNFHFSFRYPGNWTVAQKGGKEENIGGIRTYVLPIHIPGDVGDLEITMDGDVVQFPSFVEGHCAPDPRGPANTFCYYHAHVSGWPAMHINRISGGQIDSIDTITNTHTRSYDVRIVTGTPPFPANVMSGYKTIVRTLKVPFS